MKKFTGVGVALITPFTEDGSVDFQALTRLLEHTQSVDFYVVLGTTGEPATMTLAERHAVVRHVVAHNPTAKPIVVGLGGNCTAALVDALQTFDLSGVSAVLSVVPYYNKPNQEGIFQHYSVVAKHSPLPVILYNVPGRTGVNMTAATTLRLAREFGEKIIGVKEASGNLAQVAHILRDRPNNFVVLSGDDNLTLPIIALGGDGVISVSVNAFTSKFTDMVHSAMDGDLSTASHLNLTLHEATELLFEEGNPGGIKAALASKSIISNVLRLPLTPVSQNLCDRIAVQIQNYDL
ncbi:MAG: 4-hydroxy-tetrahydrodipicolinate synthase [Mucinivorans sp.]